MPCVSCVREGAITRMGIPNKAEDRNAMATESGK